MKYGFIEVELKPVPRVLSTLSKRGINWVELGRPKIIHVLGKCFPKHIHEAILDGDWSALGSKKIPVEIIKKVRPSTSKALTGDSKIEAGLKKEAYLFANKKNVVMYTSKPSKNWCVYLLRMADSAFEKTKMKRANKTLPKSEYPVYVGQTSLEREARFQNHTNPEAPGFKKRSKFFNENAYSNVFSECSLTEDFQQYLGKIDGLTQYESLAKEREVTELLRAQYGYWTYSA